MKVFKLNDCDWYLANSLEEAIEVAMKDTGLPRDEVVDDPYELDEEQMNTVMFDNQDGSKWPFAVELQNMIEAGIARPGMFASTEW